MIINNFHVDLCANDMLEENVDHKKRRVTTKSYIVGCYPYAQSNINFVKEANS